MTKEETQALCIFVNGWILAAGSINENTALEQDLKKTFPGYNWRVILSHAGERTRWVLTTENHDYREHYLGTDGKCTLCGKTKAQLKRLGIDVERINHD